MVIIQLQVSTYCCDGQDIIKTEFKTRHEENKKIADLQDQLKIEIDENKLKLDRRAY